MTAPSPFVFEFWNISSHSIEEQLLMYDIPFTENYLSECLIDEPIGVKESFINMKREKKKKNENEIKKDEESLFISESQVKSLPTVSIDSLLNSLVVTSPKVILLPKMDEENEKKKENSSVSTPRIEVKTDKYGFVVTDEEEQIIETTSSSTPRKQSSATRERSSTLNRKKIIKIEEKWRIINKNWDVYLNEKRKKLKRNLRRGVPDSLRAELWKGLMDVKTIKEENVGLFQSLQEQECEEDFERVILKDLSRTLPKHIMFQEEGGQGRKSLHSILKAYSLYNPSVGYCQGMGFLVGMFLIYMTAEDAFFMLIRVIDNLGLSGIFAEGLLAVKEHLYIHALLIKTQFPRLSSHLEETIKIHGCMPVEVPWDVTKLYATQWFFNIFIHVLPFEFILRVWDVLLFDGFSFVHQVALAILKVAQKDLLKLNFDELLLFLKDIDTYLSKNITPEQFISICLEYKVSARITKLSKTYNEQFSQLPM